MQLKTSVLIVDPQYLTRNGLFHLLDNLDDLNIEMQEDVLTDEDYSGYDDSYRDRKSTRLNSSHPSRSRMPSSA